MPPKVGAFLRVLRGSNARSCVLPASITMRWQVQIGRAGSRESCGTGEPTSSARQRPLRGVSRRRDSLSPPNARKCRAFFHAGNDGAETVWLAGWSDSNCGIRRGRPTGPLAARVSARALPISVSTPRRPVPYYSNEEVVKASRSACGRWRQRATSCPPCCCPFFRSVGTMLASAQPRSGAVS
jgi:hypothetical protein